MSLWKSTAISQNRVFNNQIFFITLACPEIPSRNRSPPKNSLFAPSSSRLLSSLLEEVKRSSANISGWGNRSTDSDSHSNFCNRNVSYIWICSCFIDWLDKKLTLNQSVHISNKRKTLKRYMNFLLLEKSRASLRLTTCYQ